MEVTKDNKYVNEFNLLVTNYENKEIPLEIVQDYLWGLSDFTLVQLCEKKIEYYLNKT